MQTSLNSRGPEITNLNHQQHRSHFTKEIYKLTLCINQGFIQRDSFKSHWTEVGLCNAPYQLIKSPRLVSSDWSHCKPFIQWPKESEMPQAASEPSWPHLSPSLALTITCSLCSSLLLPPRVTLSFNKGTLWYKTCITSIVKCAS